MKAGEHVWLMSYGDVIIQRRIVSVGELHVYVTTDDEYDAALREDREPVAIGFRLSEVVGVGDTLNIEARK
ncbi:MAG: hypothetical protein JWQ89_3337 [Devosia sp.]|uniref:hypothetical protein n=1 Tax=Devosia sp. TaxID=1871048 RepID=UPI0026276EF3|nr:hypothetical protein [Devosia sp.]MDB5541610.1 hypothetical protein [Devosia sp.]